MRPRTLITVPNGRGWIHKHVTLALLRMMRDPAGCEINIMLPTHAPYVHNLHVIREEFLSGPYDYWLSMDDDNPPMRNPLELVQLDLDVVGCPTPVWANLKPDEPPIYWNAMDEVIADDGTVAFRPHSICRGLQEVDAIGSGCFLVARRVMETLRAPFMREWNSNGTVETGGDFAFGKRARAAGFRIYAHYDYACQHFHEIEIGEVAQAAFCSDEV